MFDYMADYKEDVLKITDEQVASDWRFGLLRAVGSLVAGRAYPADSTGPYGAVVQGSNRAHIMGGIGLFGNGEKECPLVEVYEVKEAGGESWNFSTFGSTSDATISVSAVATCSCGRITRHPVSMAITPGEFIYEVTHAI